MQSAAEARGHLVTALGQPQSMEAVKQLCTQHPALESSPHSTKACTAGFRAQKTMRRTKSVSRLSMHVLELLLKTCGPVVMYVAARHESCGLYCLLHLGPIRCTSLAMHASAGCSLTEDCERGCHQSGGISIPQLTAEAAAAGIQARRLPMAGSQAGPGFPAASGLCRALGPAVGLPGPA